VSDRDELARVVSSVVAANPEAVESFRTAGEAKVLGYLVGQVMRATQGRADPRLVNEMLRETLGG
jgi:aspartyl-tRNA(Asn)/glutamyl-tRNA(Gln) amidotransferase subunit B